MNQSTASTTERQSFYRWIESCPLIDYRICDASPTSVTYTFQFNSPEPDIDQLYDQVLADLQK